ncbi:hypothetical protein [Candidatus Solirubrobacter pratensis]|uniref:hypothetical protein n=1 Tax=Candidatus Solirubrobacter pratensis TaxID=1298857 RepID=UPI0004819D72|nr:hypothetical protein [Candidatus Solirubrobacter pratensis]
MSEYDADRVAPAYRLAYPGDGADDDDAVIVTVQNAEALPSALEDHGLIMMSPSEMRDLFGDHPMDWPMRFVGMCIRVGAPPSERVAGFVLPKTATKRRGGSG